MVHLTNPHEFDGRTIRFTVNLPALAEEIARMPRPRPIL